jgi:hypothetical protein
MKGKLHTKYSVLIFAITLVFADSKCRKINERANNDSEVKCYFKLVGSNENGWMYQIYWNEEMIIDQDVIPAAGGMQKFSSYGDAKRTAELVLAKLKKTNVLPSISLQDLDSLNVDYKNYPQ